MKLRRCNKYMFRTVKCSKYMRKVNDGKCITLLTGDKTESGMPAYFYTDYSEEKEKDRFREVPSEDWGGGGFMKTYYEPSIKEFVGIVIGMKMITVKAELFCDTNYGYDGSERDYIGRDVKEQMKVAVVAYGCNKTRLVPMDSFEIIKGEKEISLLDTGHRIVYRLKLHKIHTHRICGGIIKCHFPGPVNSRITVWADVSLD